MDTLPDVFKKDWKKIHPFNKKIAKEFLSQSHYSPDTIKQYASALKIFFTWCLDYKQNKPLCELKPKDGMDYQNFIANQGLYPHSIRLKRSVVASLCGYFEVFYSEEFPQFRNIFNKYVPNVSNAYKYEKEYITKKEMMYLTNELRKSNKRTKLEMIAFIWFTYVTGARRAEVAQIKKEIINYDKEVNKNYYLTHVVRAKGKGKEGEVKRLPFDDVAMIYLREWMNHRGEDECPYLFIFRTNNPDGDKFNRWCKEVFSKILNKRVHPHMFRRTRATHLVQDGKSIEVAQELLGHKDPSTTKMYVINKRDKLEDVF